MNIINPEIKTIKTIEHQQYDVLYNISKRLISADYSNELFEDALDLVIEMLCADRAILVKSGPEFEIVSARNNSKESLKNINLFSQNILQQVAETKSPVLYHDVQANPNASKFESLQIQNINSIIGVPVIRNNEVWGIILADSRKDRTQFNNDNLKFLSFFANILSLALDKIETLEQLNKKNIQLENQLTEVETLPDVIGNSKVMKTLNKTIRKIASKNISVLILGESGTGKDVIAKAIHSLSNRSDKPFIVQNCSSIPDSLLESELFGYKKGAFTGGNQDKEGLFEAANGGTFFLDEIGDMPLNLQAKILRVLENQEISRLGDTKTKKIDVRIIAATNQDLKLLVKQNKFREDLYFRLNVFPVELPPLRERKTDISHLAKFFIEKHAEEKLSLTKEALSLLEKHNWPGNVRELQNIIKRAVIIAENNKIVPDDINIEIDNEAAQQGTLKELELNLLAERLKKFDGNRTKTAESLGVSVRWVQLKLKESGLEL